MYMKNHKEVEKVYLAKGRKWPELQFYYVDGTRGSKALHCDWKTANKILEKIRNRIALGNFEMRDFFTLKVKSITLADASIEYIDKRDRDVRINKLSKNTLNTDYFSLKILIEVVGKKILVGKINKDVILKFMLVLKEEKKNQYGVNYSDSSIRVYLKHLSSFFSWAIDQGYATSNPIIGIVKPLEKGKQAGNMKLLNQEYLKKLREYLQKKPEWQLDVLNFSLGTGARRGEIIKVKKKDLVNLKVKGGKKYLIRLNGKGGKTRLVPIGNECLKLVKKRIKYLSNEKERERILEKQVSSGIKKRYRYRWQQEYLFFEICDDKSISKAIMKARRHCGVPESITFHSARHTYATHLIAEGVDIKVLKELLGHVDLETTEIYTHVLNEHMLQQVEAVTEL